jgi:hypothetical protein
MIYERPPWLDLGLEEYKALRSEIIETQKAQQWTVGLSFTALGIVASQVTDLLGSPVAAVAVFIVLIPLVICAFLLVWLAQIGGMMRLGGQIWRLEQRVHEDGIAPEEIFAWESYLRRPESKTRSFRLYEWGYQGIVAIYSFLALGSIVLGRHGGKPTDDELGLLGGNLAGISRVTLLALLVAAVVIVVDLFSIRELRKLRGPVDESPDSGRQAAPAESSE